MTMKRQNRNPNKPPAQPRRSPQCRFSRTCCILQRVHLTLKCPMVCPGLATHTLAGPCAMCLPSAASSSGTLPHTPPKLQPPQTTCSALPQPPVQDKLHLLRTAEAAFDLAVPHGMLRADHSHTGRVVRLDCQVMPPSLEISTNQQNCNPPQKNQLPSAPAAPSSSSTTPS